MITGKVEIVEVLSLRRLKLHGHASRSLQRMHPWRTGAIRCLITLVTLMIQIIKRLNLKTLIRVQLASRLWIVVATLSRISLTPMLQMVIIAVRWMSLAFDLWIVTVILCGIGLALRLGIATIISERMGLASRLCVLSWRCEAIIRSRKVLNEAILEVWAVINLRCRVLTVPLTIECLVDRLTVVQYFVMFRGAIEMFEVRSRLATLFPTKVTIQTLHVFVTSDSIDTR